MKRFALPRRSLWLVLGIVIAALAAAAAVAVAGLQPADLAFTPQVRGADARTSTSLARGPRTTTALRPPTPGPAPPERGTRR